MGAEELPYNVNVGVLGHVDSGKTSLSKALSTQGSTACFDKSPQSKERGITLDLGFSAFEMPPPASWEGKHAIPQVQYTLVDCPGHASLIKCIIGGAQIIDMMMLVIDINKGIQTQTAECIVIGEMLATNLTVVLNKCDLIPGDAEQRAKVIEKTKKRLEVVFANTKFQAPKFIATSAAPAASDQNKAEGLDELRAALSLATPAPRTAAEEEKKFLMYIDHCFAIEGQGTILTGTILQGRVSAGSTVFFPETKVERKVKSIQVFKRPVKYARRGDRIGMSVSKFDASMERGIVCAVGGNVRTYTCGVARIEKVRHYKLAIPSNSKLHVTVGHATVMGVVRFFCKPAVDGEDPAFDPTHTYRWLDELEAEKTKEEKVAPNDGGKSVSATKDIPPLKPLTGKLVIYALIQFEQPLTTPIGATLIASKLDVDVHTNMCRLCFHGHMECAFKAADIPALRAMKEKVRPATIDRVVDDYTCIGKNLVQAKTGDLTRFIGKKLLFEPPRDPVTRMFPEGKVPIAGTIDSTFGKSGKFKVIFKEPVFKKDAKGATACPKYKLFFRFEVNHFDKSKTMVQDFTGVL